jgi:molybdopterin molybdotransferase
LAEVGARLVVDGVAVRPGHPMVLAVLPGHRPLVGLPGNPLAAVGALLVLLGPLLDGLTRAAPAEPERAGLEGWEPRGRPAAVLLPVRRRADRLVEPAGPSGPAQLRGLAAADAVAVVPPGWTAGDLVELLRLP